MARQGDALENPVTGERLVFRQTTADSGGAVLSFAYFLPAGGSVPLATSTRGRRSGSRSSRGGRGFGSAAAAARISRGERRGAARYCPQALERRRGRAARA